MKLAKDRLEHIRYISENFSQLKGLVSVPSGLVLVSFGLLRSEMLSTEYVYALSFPIFLLLLSIIIASVMYFQYMFIAKANQYYAHRFGQTQDSIKQQRRYLNLTIIFLVVLAVGGALQFAFNQTNIFAATFLGIVGVQSWMTSGPRLDAKLFGLAFILTGVIFLFTNHFDVFQYLYLIIGGWMIAQGLINHLYLRRHLKLDEHHA